MIGHGKRKLVVGGKVKQRLYHRAKLVSNDGSVSALCFAKPRAIDLDKANWTNRDEAVTCPRCRKLINAKASQRDAEISRVIITWTCERCGWANDNNNGPCRKCGAR